MRNPCRQDRIISEIAGISEQNYFNPGTIIIAEHVEEAYNKGSTIANDNSIVRTLDGNTFCNKPRRFIILAKHALHYICIPIYSHNGNGTKYKPKPEEFVSIRDHRATIKARAQSIHEPLLTMDMAGIELTAPSVAHLAYPVSRSFTHPFRIIGRLSFSSTARAIQLYKTFVPQDYRGPSSASQSNLSIHAGLSVYDALTDLRLDTYALLFRNMSWEKAARLSENDLEGKGIRDLTARVNLSSLFDKVEKASRSGPDWNVKIDKNSLAVV